MNKSTTLMIEYENAVKDLLKFCEDNTDYSVVIKEDVYPFRVQYIPNMQLSVFGDENVSEDGEINDMTVEVGLNTKVQSTLKFKMDSKLLKKLIKLAEKTDIIYYHAYRAKQDDEETEQAKT